MKAFTKLGLLQNTIFVSLRGAKRRSNLVLSSENKIAALPSVARNDTFGEFRNSPKLGIVLFIFVLSGCAVITNFDGVLALKRLGDSQRDNEKYVRRQEKLFYKLGSDIKANRLKKGLSESKVLSGYGQPVLSKPVEDNLQIKEVFVYRHTMQYFPSETIYLYFNERQQLCFWESMAVKPPER